MKSLGFQRLAGQERNHSFAAEPGDSTCRFLIEQPQQRSKVLRIRIKRSRSFDKRIGWCFDGEKAEIQTLEWNWLEASEAMEAAE